MSNENVLKKIFEKQKQTIKNNEDFVCNRFPELELVRLDNGLVMIQEKRKR